MDTNNLSIVRQTFANTVFTHKVHEIACERLDRFSFIVKIINTLMVSVVLALLVLQVANPIQITYSYTGAGITVAEVIFLVVQLTFSFEESAGAHKISALKYMGLRDQYRILITDIMNKSISKKELRSRRNLLQREYQVISDMSPQTNNSDYKKTQKRINKEGVVVGEDFTWSDEEINQFLPEGLRLKS